MDVWKSFTGMLILEITGADPEATLGKITQSRIPLSQVVQTSPLTYAVQIRRRDLRAVTRILEKQGDKGKILRRRGLFWGVQRLAHRPVLLGLGMLLFLSSLYLPTKVFFVRVEGNETLPARQILAAAEDCGIRFGTSRKEVRSEQVKNALLSALPQLQWAGVNTAGCTAYVSVRERTEENQAVEKGQVSNLVADRDGYILSATVTGGTAQVRPGEAVTKGQLLISGYTDCGICIRAGRAEGEILAQTNRQLTAIMPQIHRGIDQTGKPRYKISLLLGKKRINLWKDSRISPDLCGRMYREYFVSLPGGFRLPAAICVDRYVTYTFRDGKLPEDLAQAQLQAFSDSHLIRQMRAGQILQSRQQFSRSRGLYRLESSYTCTEIIGKEQREQIGDINGKRN